MVMAVKQATAIRGTAALKISQPNTSTMRNQAYTLTIILDSL